MEAAERGDVAALNRLAKELRDWKEGESAASTGGEPVIERARELGLAEARTAATSGT